jgi:hypothetical protein
MRMFGSALTREHTIADQALASVLTDHNEHLANLIGADGACGSRGCFVSSHVAQQCVTKVHQRASAELDCTTSIASTTRGGGSTEPSSPTRDLFQISTAFFLILRIRRLHGGMGAEHAAQTASIAEVQSLVFDSPIR